MMKMIPQEEDDTQGSSHSESSEESEMETTRSGLHTRAEEEDNTDAASTEEACTSVSASLLFFCKKRGSWLLGCFTTMVISAALFVLNKVLGQWQLREEILDDGSVEKTYEPGNNGTFLLLVVSILLFQASLSVLLVLFLYVYKRDIQEQQGVNQNSSSGNASQELSLADEYALLQLEQPHLFSSSTRDERGIAFRETLLYYFYQKHTAYIHAVGSLLFASIVFLIVPRVCSRHSLIPLLLGIVLLLASGTMASCLLYVHLYRTMRRYRSRRTFQRQLSMGAIHNKGATTLPPKGSLALLQLLNFLVHATVFWALVVHFRTPIWSFVLVTLVSSVACISWYLWVGPVSMGSTTSASSMETCSETEPADEDSAREAAEMV